MLPTSPPAAGEVLAEAERIVREEQDRELERDRRKARREALQEEKQRLAREERERPEHIAVYTRNQWSIENKSHYVRDVTFREDSSQVRTGSRPRILATLRNLIRQAGLTGIAATVRAAQDDNDLLVALLRLETAP